VRRGLARLASLLAGLLLPACASLPAPVDERAFCGELWSADEVTAARVAAARAGGTDTIVLALHDGMPAAAALTAAELVRGADLRLGYWLEVGRSPALAERHPQWLASLQGHDEWRRQFPELGTAAPDQIVKVWPWLPVAYAEAFAAHRDRVAAQLAALPTAEFVFLNDLQGPPAACGCGNTLCRWATDYTLGGRAPLRTTTPLGADAAARFVAAVQQLAPNSEVIPVWVTECEEADTVADGACCGVGCYHGACWREFDRQWLALRAGGGRTALLLPYLAFGRDLERFGEPAGWIGFAIEHLRTRMRERHRTEVPPESLIAVLQGWGAVAPRAVQQARAAAAGVTRTLLAREPIEQSWAPRLLTVAADAGAGR
jgi:hypothetical protein